MDGPAGLVPGATPEATQAIGTEPKKGVPRSCLGGLVGGALAAVVVVVIIIAALGGDDLVDPLCAGISCGSGGSCQAGSCVCNQGFNSPGGGASPCVENTCTPLQTPTPSGGVANAIPAGYMVRDATATTVSALGWVLCNPDPQWDAMVYLVAADDPNVIPGYFATACDQLRVTCDTNGGAFTFTGCAGEQRLPRRDPETAAIPLADADHVPVCCSQVGVPRVPAAATVCGTSN